MLATLYLLAACVVRAQESEPLQQLETVVVWGNRIAPAPGTWHWRPLADGFSGPQPSYGGSRGKMDSPSSDDGSAPECASSHPVLLATGEKYKPETDVFSNGLYGFGALIRTYRSKSATGRLFGPNWPSTFDYIRLSYTFTNCFQTEIGCMPGEVLASFSDGTQFRYRYVWQETNGYSVNGAAQTGDLFYDPFRRTWYLRYDKRDWYFQAGRLVRMAGPNGESLTQSYNTNGQLTRVTNAAGQSVLFGWDNGRVTRVTDPAGNVWTCGYDAHGMLQTVASPGSPPDVRTYHYEDPGDRTLLTGISINGVRYSTYRYFADKRVSESGIACGEDRDTLAYGTGATTVTSASGQPTTYAFTDIGGSPKVVSISRAVTASCPAATAATAATTYDANGYVDYTLDWNGVKTDYAYDTTGKLLRVTRAADTGSASTVEHVWQGEDVVQTTWRDANGAAYARVNYVYVATGPAAGLLASEVRTDLRTGAQRSLIYGYTFYANNTLASYSVTRALPGGSATTTYTYDALGNLASMTNPLGHQVAWSNYNGLGRPGRMTDAHGVVTEYGYDAKGNLITSTVYLPGGTRTTTYAYNNNRQVTDIAEASGRIVRLRYNAATRLEQVGNASNEFQRRDINVSSNTVTIRANRNMAGLSGNVPTAVTGGEFTAVTQYDTLGRDWKRIGNAGQLVRFTYDNNGNVRTRTDAAGRVTVYEYDARDRVRQITAPDGGVTAFGYDAEGNLAFVQDPRGLRTTFTYNGFGQVLAQSSPDTGTTTYAYDSAGRLATATRADGVTVAYTWDALDRLTSRSAGGMTETFTYDEGAYGKGRLTRINDASGQTTFAYDAAGNLVRQVSSVPTFLAGSLAS
ncbi:MAG: hypothetical protein OHK0044_27110 [Burkholderiaceae bacterium]